MSPGEVIILVGSIALAAVGWLRWYWLIARVPAIKPAGGMRWLVGSWPAVCALLLLVILKLWAAGDVRDDARYMTMYWFLGAAWVQVLLTACPLLGVSLRDDVCERGNAAASIVLCGAMTAFTLAFAGANIGDGPGWWVVFASAGASCAGVIALWILIELLADPTDAVTVDRDAATALRIAGALTVAGLIMGRGVAGDWRSYTNMLADFASVSWPVLGLLPAEWLAWRVGRPSPTQPQPSVMVFGVFPVMVYLAAAAAYLIWLGWW